MATFDPRVARLANLTRSSLARAFEESADSRWATGVRQELRAWLSLGISLEFFPTDAATLAAMTRVFGKQEEAGGSLTTLFREWTSAERERLHSYLQSALQLADYLLDDAAACRLLAALAFTDQDTWNGLLVKQHRLVTAKTRNPLDRIVKIAEGGTWLFDGTVRLLHHLQAFHRWAELVTAGLVSDAPAEEALLFVRAVASLQQWRLDILNPRTALRWRQVTTATEAAGALLSTLEDALDPMLWIQWMDQSQSAFGAHVHSGFLSRV